VTRPPSTALVWFAVLGGPLAWAVQFVVNLWFTYARCSPAGRWQLPVDAWQIAVSVMGLAVGLAALAVAVRLYRQTSRIEDLAPTVRRGFGGAPPMARVNFLAVVGLTVDGLTVAIILMSAIGAPLLAVCQQS
jgi:hypothetical protein